MLAPVCNNYECEYMGTPKGFCSCQVCARGYPKPIAMKPQTNADRIRAMTDEELATWIAGRKETCPPIKFYGCSFKTCGECWLDWLREKAEGGE